ncbi:MAG: VOC family protein [Verrucomicrobiota bacterium]
MPLESHFVFHHVGLAVKDIEASTKALSSCGLKASEEFPDAIDELIGVRLRFLAPNGNGPLVELVSGLDEVNPVRETLSKNGVCLYHMCFEVPNLVEAANHLKSSSYLAVSNPIKAKAFSNRPIQFFYHVDSGLIEILEARPGTDGK